MQLHVVSSVNLPSRAAVMHSILQAEAHEGLDGVVVGGVEGQAEREVPIGRILSHGRRRCGERVEWRGVVWEWEREESGRRVLGEVE
jgi:hypothetical protein